MCCTLLIRWSMALAVDITHGTVLRKQLQLEKSFVLFLKSFMFNVLKFTAHLKVKFKCVSLVISSFLRDFIKMEID